MTLGGFDFIIAARDTSFWEQLYDPTIQTKNQLLFNNSLHL